MKLNDVLERGQEAMRPPVSGQVVGVSGLTVWVEGARSAIGDVVEISTKGKRLPAQVVGVSEDRLACMPLGEMAGIAPGVSAEATNAPLRVPIGQGLLGRVIDALGNPIDSLKYLVSLGRILNRSGLANILSACSGLTKPLLSPASTYPP